MNLLQLLPQRLSSKIVGVLIGFLLLALFAIGTTLILSWQLEGSAAAINEAGGLRMQSYRLTSSLARLNHESKKASLHDTATQQLLAINATFTRLQRGDPQRPLYLPPSDNIDAAFDQVMQRWHMELEPLSIAILKSEASEHLPYWENHLALIDGFVTDIDKLVQAIEHDSEKRMT